MRLHGSQLVETDTAGRCGLNDKICFIDEEAALAALMNITILVMNGARSSKYGGAFESGIYECRGCRYWHLTSHPVEDLVFPLESSA